MIGIFPFNFSGCHPIGTCISLDLLAVLYQRVHLYCSELLHGISAILIKMWRFLRSSQIASPGSVRNCTAAAVAFIATTSHNNVSALTTFWNLITAKVPC